ncbi:putative ankyrin repeat protein [Cotonvirus japonicus]|uniref:Ankyrin repeat protein n=1 Tax=Cotonvirus japonicus TaxID=2811091 RepID=A0ABM7NRH1_9VIRU|nr:putative ankyrin repeat protein [Cotonvirus japonicus]BCS82762.1 putative ankyrin repeat protein [Cotonvirus japonicus]
MGSSLTNKKFYKFISDNWIQRDYLYKEGLNILDKSFERHGSCVPGGLYFTDIEHILDYMGYGKRLVEVTIPFDAQIVEDSMYGFRKWRADKIIVKNIGLITEINTIKFLLDYPFEIVDISEILLKLYSYSLENNYYKLLEYLIKNFLEDFPVLHKKIMLTLIDLDLYDEKILQLLIQHGAKFFNTFISDVVKHENITLILTIIRYKPSKIETLYNFAMKHNKFDIVKIILQCVPKIKSCYSINDKIFDSAIKKGNIDTIKYMIDNKFYLSVNLFSYILNKHINGSIIMYLWLNYGKITENNILTTSDNCVKNFKGEIIDTNILNDQDIDYNVVDHICKMNDITNFKKEGQCGLITNLYLNHYKFQS